MENFRFIGDQFIRKPQTTKILSTDTLEAAMGKLFNDLTKAKDAPEWIVVDGEMIRMAKKPTPAEAVCNPAWLRGLMSSKAQ